MKTEINNILFKMNDSKKVKEFELWAKESGVIIEDYNLFNKAKEKQQMTLLIIIMMALTIGIIIASWILLL